MFVGREAELTRLRRAVDLGLNAVVTGPAGSGVTSTLRRVAWLLRKDGIDPLHVSAADVEDPGELLLRILRRVAGEEAAALAVLAGVDPPGLLDRLVASTAARTVLLVDDLSPVVGRALFGALRDEMWRVEATWIVGIAAGDVDAVLRPPVDVFFEVVVDLPPLLPKQVRTLLRRRGVDLAKADTGVVADLSGGIPRQVIDLAREIVVDGRSVDDLVGRRSVREARLSAVSGPAAALVEVLESLGAASPSDAAVQARMGVSRPRLVTLFAELRAAGLVREVPPDRSSATPGRPRLRYVLASAEPDGSGSPTVADAGMPETVGGVRDPAGDDH